MTNQRSVHATYPGAPAAVFMQHDAAPRIAPANRAPERCYRLAASPAMKAPRTGSSVD